MTKKLAPCVLFVDEIEVLLGNRDNEFSNHNLNQIKIAEFLTAWDGFEKNVGQPVVVIGATNRIKNLDAAILRRMPIKVNTIKKVDKTAQKNWNKKKILV